MTSLTQEEIRLEQTRNHQAKWRKWGPYLSDRQWGTVREDYSPNGTAWDYFTHDQARSRAYRWGEDGILGFPMTTNNYVLLLLFGMVKMQLLRKDFLA